jgi:hypothetical protein
MSSSTSIDLSGKPFLALAADLVALGFFPGLPPQVSPETRLIDRTVCTLSRCPSCRRAGRSYHPFARGAAYRMVACCDRCGTGEEM